jgi:hypothetical protein
MNKTGNVTNINPHWRPRPEIQTIYQFFEGYKKLASDEALTRFIEDNKSIPIGADVKVSVHCESFI